MFGNEQPMEAVGDGHLIETAEDATPEWFTAVIQAAGWDVSVTDVSVSPVGTGQMAESARFSLSYEGDTDAPANLIGKFPSRDEGNRAAGAQGGYAAEVRFYQSIASTVDIDTPACLVALLAPDEIGFTLLLEDMAPAIPGDQIAGCTVEEANDAVINLAGLHGPRWSDPSLLTLEGLASPGDVERVEFVQLLMADLTPAFIARFEAHLSAADKEILTTFAANVGHWLMRELHGFGLVHGDYRLDNLLFAGTDSPRPVTAVDWQTLTIGPPVNDLSYFLGNGLVPDVRLEFEATLVSSYHAALMGYGRDALTIEDCFEQYRWGTFHGPLITIVGSMMVGQTERGDEMFMAMLSRSLRQIRDLETIDLLRS